MKTLAVLVISVLLLCGLSSQARAQDQPGDKHDKQKPAKPEKLTNLRKMQLIQDVLEKEVRPQLWADGGDLELVDIDGAKVQIAFRKACAGCVSSGYTARFVEQKLRDLVADDIVVEEVEG